MKKAIIFILMALMVIQIASANLLGQHVVGTPDAGTLPNTYDVDGYVYSLRGSDHQFITQPLSSIQPTMYLTMFLEDNNKVLTVSLWNYNTSTWTTLGTMPIGLKISAQFSINTTNHYDPVSNVMQVRMTEANGVWLVDKFIISSAGLVETIKRVEQVDWVGNVGALTKQTPTLDVLGTYYEIGDTAKVIAQISTAGLPVNDASCFTSIYHPDDSLHIRNTRMAHIPQSDGLYTYTMVIPEEDESLGVWPVSVVCDFATESEVFYPGNIAYNWGTIYNSGQSIFYDDENYSRLETEWDGLSDKIDVELTYYNVTSELSEASRLLIAWQGYTDMTGESATVYFWNDDTSQWIPTINTLESEYTDASFEAVKLDNETPGKYFDASNNVKVRIAGTASPIYENIDFFTNGIEYSPQILPDDGTTYGIVTDEVNPEIDFSITGTDVISGNSSLKIIGSTNDTTTATVYADVYLTNHGVLKYKNGVFEKIEGNMEITARLRGNPVTEEWRGNVRFVVPSTPAGGEIESATLYTFYHTVKNDAVCNVDFINVPDWYPLDASDWNTAGTTMFTESTASVVDHTYYPKDVTSYVSGGNVFAFRTVATRQVPSATGECILSLENDNRFYLYIKYKDGSGYVVFPADSTGYNDIVLSYKRQVTGAESTDFYKVEVSNDAGSTWSLVESFTANSGLQTISFPLNSSFDNNPNIRLRLYARSDTGDDIFTFDDFTLNGEHRIYGNIYTDYITISVINAVDVINEVRGGGEFNVKDRVAGLEEILDGINITLDDVFFSAKYQTEFIMPSMYSPYDPAVVNVYLYDKKDHSIGIIGATCTLNIYGPASSLNQGPLVLSSYALTEQGGGIYYGAPASPLSGWQKGLYRLEANCLYDGQNYYNTETFRMEDKIYERTADEVWFVNRTIEPGLLEQMSTNIWNFVSRYIHGEILN